MALPLAPNAVFKREHTEDWTLARISRLSAQDIKQLLANAQRLSNTEVVALCLQALAAATPARSSRSSRRPVPRTKPGRLIARGRAFEARGVWLRDPRASWSGLRKSDGAVVMALWVDAIESSDGGCACLLWAPNVDGSRPWSDQPAGAERLEHCKRALQLGQAEGLLVYGERCAGYIPEDRAHTVHGVDPETIIVFRVEKRGEEFWGKWGGKSA